MWISGLSFLRLRRSGWINRLQTFISSPSHYLKLYEMTAQLQDQALAALRENVADKDYQQVQADFLNFRESGPREDILQHPLRLGEDLRIVRHHCYFGSCLSSMLNYYRSLPCAYSRRLRIRSHPNAPSRR
jgi:hypothetical protein